MPEQRLSFIHRFVEGSELRTLLLLHGTGGDEEDLLPLGRELAPGANLLSPRGKVLENGMPRFFRRLALGVFDVEDLKLRAGELAGFVSEAASAYGLDAGRISAVGFSNGANIAAATILLHPHALAAAILFKTQFTLEPPELPGLDGMPLFVSAGRFDQLIPSSETERVVKLLEQAGADVTTHWTNGGHELRPDEVVAARAWAAGSLP